jgi:UDP-N-acetylglucosamine 2-epimerase (non-hydrolysing)
VPFRIAVVVGTRPEVIKMAPVVAKLTEAPDIQVVNVVTAQHRELLDQVLGLFGVGVDVDLDLMRSDQALGPFVARALDALSAWFVEAVPDVVLVQGDTNTAMAAALAAFYLGIPVGHVEAGLRSHDRKQPFPEEVNRRVITSASDVHFAPTEGARRNLAAEGVPSADIVVTGNTIVDALQSLDLSGPFDDGSLDSLGASASRRVLVTAHRRENFGEPLRQVCHAIARLTDRRDVEFVYPVHPNPNVQRVVNQELEGLAGVHLVAPVSYGDLLRLLRSSHFVLTDSGGIQEEAPSFNTPVLVLRDVTERPELIESGGGLLVGAAEDVIVRESLRLLDDDAHHQAMASAQNPFGDGRAAERITATLRARLQQAQAK